jgi:hypothetical protein
MLIMAGFGLSLLAPRPAAAFGPTTVLVDIPRSIFQAVDKVRQKIAEAFRVQGAVGFKSSLAIVERKLLDEVKTNLAAVGPGQKPLFLTSPKTFFKNVSNAAAGDFIDDFTRGVTGENGVGTSLSGDRGKFLISRLLRAQSNSVISGVTTQCKTQCATSVGITIDPKTDFKSLNETDAKKLLNELLGKAKNVHDKNIIYIRYDIDSAGGTAARVAKGEDIGSCQHITQQGATNGPVSWVINLSVINPPGAIPLADCQKHQEEAYLTEHSLAQAETRQCVNSCQSRGDALTSGVNGLTATDIFSAVQNADPREESAG